MLHRICLLLIFVAGGLFAQQHDFSMWTRSTTGSTVVIPWYMHFGDKFVIDARYNYDAKGTFGGCIGKSFGGKNLSLVPEACGYIGEVDGFGPELLVMGSKGKTSLFSQNQYVHGMNSRDSFLYHWTDLLLKTNKNLSLGVDWQIFKLTGISAPVAVDVGPAVKVMFGKVYFRIWPCWAIDPKDSARRGNPTLFLGVGYAR